GNDVKVLSTKGLDRFWQFIRFREERFARTKGFLTEGQHFTDGEWQARKAKIPIEILPLQEGETYGRRLKFTNHRGEIVYRVLTSGPQSSANKIRFVDTKSELFEDPSYEASFIARRLDQMALLHAANLEVGMDVDLIRGESRVLRQTMNIF